MSISQSKTDLILQAGEYLLNHIKTLQVLASQGDIEGLLRALPLQSEGLSAVAVLAQERQHYNLTWRRNAKVRAKRNESRPNPSSSSPRALPWGHRQSPIQPSLSDGPGAIISGKPPTGIAQTLVTQEEINQALEDETRRLAGMAEDGGG
jgi:hypothetical protein